MDSNSASPADLSTDLLPDARAAAEYVGNGMNRQKIYHMVKAGHLRAIRKGPRLYFRKSWLIEDFSDASPVTAE